MENDLDVMIKRYLEEKCLITTGYIYDVSYVSSGTIVVTEETKDGDNRTTQCIEILEVLAWMFKKFSFNDSNA